MKHLKGLNVSEGIAMGVLRFYSEEPDLVKKREITDCEAEIARFEKARGQASIELVRLYRNTREKLGEENSLLFHVHRMMLRDQDFSQAVIEIIREEHANVEYAVSITAEKYSNLIASLEDGYMKSRAADVLDVAKRLLRILAGKKERKPLFSDREEPYILAAEALAPSQTAQLDKSRTLAFVTQRGTETSHTAIFARAMGIPAVTALGEAFSDLEDAAFCIVDGFTGDIWVRPDEAVKQEYIQKQERLRSLTYKLGDYREKRSVTKDGKIIRLLAVASSAEEIQAALQNGGEGIGLFRSEFLYLEEKNYPSEELQFNAYRQAAESFKGKPVVIRTLDIGSDKRTPYFDLPEEENPAMGLRGIRLCFSRRELFRTQLRALYRASVYGNLSILFPMLTSVEELRQIKAIVLAVKEELAKEQIPFNREIKLGVMIETPAAALISDHLAKEADFFSIGTNDLTQYTLAVDRQNPHVAEYWASRHEAVLRLVHQVIKNAHANGIEATICGELAADESMLSLFLAMEADGLTVPSSAILPLRYKINNMEIDSRKKEILSYLD